MSDLERTKAVAAALDFRGGGRAALHVGGAALAIVHLQTDEGDDTLGRKAIEIGLEMASPRTEVIELPPGPDTDASGASPALAEQKAVEKETELPKDDADRDRGSRPDRDDRTTRKSRRKTIPKLRRWRPLRPGNRWRRRRPRSRCSRTQRKARSPPSSTRGLARISSGSPPIGAGRSAPISNCTRNIRPTGGRRATVKVSLVLNRRGNVVSVDVREPSGDAAFDEAALSMIRRSDPVPLPPAGLTDDQFSFSLDVNFKKPK